MFWAGRDQEWNVITAHVRLQGDIASSHPSIEEWLRRLQWSLVWNSYDDVWSKGPCWVSRHKLGQDQIGLAEQLIQHHDVMVLIGAENCMRGAFPGVVPWSGHRKWLLRPHDWMKLCKISSRLEVASAFVCSQLS